MPKVFLTQEQRLEERNRKMRMAIADGLCIAKQRGRLSMTDLGAQVGVSRNTMAKILAGEDAVLPVSSVLRLIDFAGLKLKEKVEAVLD